MIVDLKDYIIAAILLDIAGESHSGFARVFDADKFQDEFERVYDVTIPTPLIASSVFKLVELGGGRIVSDPFTRDYIYLDSRACTELFNEAEDNPDTVVGRAYIIGEKFIQEALLRITELTEANLLAEFYDFEEPDRLKKIDHDGDVRAKAISKGFDELQKQLDENNEAAVSLGDSLEIAKSEVSALRVRWNDGKIRAASFVNQAQQTLVWIAQEAGKSVVGQSAKRLFDLIMDFFF